MSREFSYDATNTIGTASQTEEIQRSLIGDMVTGDPVPPCRQRAPIPTVVAPAQAPATSN